MESENLQYNSEPLVSVIIPLYNGEKFIEKCLAGVYGQTYSRIEIIIVDDASTDGSLEIVKKFSGNQKIIRQKHGDVSKARNTGILNASGHLIALLDQDDWWLPTKIEKQVSRILEHRNIDLLFTDVIKVFPSGKQQRQKDKLRMIRRIKRGDYFPVLARKNLIVPSSVIVKRTVFDQVGLFDESFKTCGDWEFWLRVAGNGLKIEFLNEGLTLYQYHGSNTSRNTALMHTDRIKAIEQIFAYNRIRARYGHLKAECLARAYYQAANNFYSDGEINKFFQLFLSGWRLNKKVIPLKVLRRYLREIIALKNRN